MCEAINSLVLELIFGSYLPEKLVKAEVLFVCPVQ